MSALRIPGRCLFLCRRYLCGRQYSLFILSGRLGSPLFSILMRSGRRTARSLACRTTALTLARRTSLSGLLSLTRLLAALLTLACRTSLSLTLACRTSLSGLLSASAGTAASVQRTVLRTKNH